MAARAGFTAGARARGARGALARGAAEGGEPKVSPTTPAATLEALERTLGLPAVPPAVEADDRARLEAQVPSGPSDGAPPPEVINGRAAMVAFLAAAGAELATHDSVFKQLGEGGLGGMFVVFAAVTAASFAPLARGKSVQETFLKNGKPEEFGPFNADAEMLNGRAAMMGFLTLLILEGLSGQSFF